MNALATALKVNVNVAYLDGHDQEGKVSFVPFQNAPFTFLEPINLLYRWVSPLGAIFARPADKCVLIRPGHYDILDRRDADPIPSLLV